MPPGRNLTAGQLSDLRRLGDAVRRAGPGDYGPTVLLVVESVRVYRRGGASLTELARALSIEITILRDWLDQYAHKEPRLLQPENLPDVWSPAAATHQALRTHGVLACTGNRYPGGNDFTKELVTIRDRVEPRFIMTERTMIEPAELPNSIDRTHPCVLHVAAHSQNGAVFLTNGGEPISVQHTHLVEALLSARHRPSILVLNFCGSLALHMHAQQVADAVVCWPDRVNDEQCLEFAGILYRWFVGGCSIGASLDRARISLSRHGGLALPRLSGDASTQLQ
jgi:hypothetical protein